MYLILMFFIILKLYVYSLSQNPEELSDTNESEKTKSESFSRKLNNLDLNENSGWRTAKVVCDYDATNMEEMSLMMGEVSSF